MGAALAKRASPAPVLRQTQIGQREFDAIRVWIRGAAGISLSDQKKALVAGRLASRLRHYGLDSYARYFELLQGGTQPDQLQIALDLLTTNHPHFFPQPNHSAFPPETLLPTPPPAPI